MNLISLSPGTFGVGQIANRIGFKRLVDNVSIPTVFGLFLWVRFWILLCLSSVSYRCGFLTGGIFLSFDNLIKEFDTLTNWPIYIAIASIISGLSGVVGPLAAGVIANQVSFTALFLVIGFIILIAGYLMKKTVTDPVDIPEYWIWWKHSIRTAHEWFNDCLYRFSTSTRGHQLKVKSWSKPEGVSKSYNKGSVKAADVTFQKLLIETGEIFGFLVPTSRRQKNDHH